MSESHLCPPTHSLLELRLRGMLSTHCEVLRDGVQVTRTSTLYSPLHTRFEIAGRPWQTRLHVPGGRGIDLLLMGAVSRSHLDRALLGNTAERILEAVHCDLLVLKPSQT